MQQWYADESASIAAREEARAEAWLSQVWARAEAQADQEARAKGCECCGVGWSLAYCFLQRFLNHFGEFQEIEGGRIDSWLNKCICVYIMDPFAHE